MSLLNILQFPDPRLKQSAALVLDFDQPIVRLVEDMFKTMYNARGVGLAATQVNVHKHVITIDVSRDQSQPLCLINTEITAKRGSIDWEEGCLSFPGVYAKIKRAESIDITFYDMLGRIQHLSTEGLLSICIQHELDHVQGITFYDRLSSPLKQRLMREKLEKNRRKAL